MGTIGAALMEQALQRADSAVMSGDLVAMITAYKELEACE